MVSKAGDQASSSEPRADWCDRSIDLDAERPEAATAEISGPPQWFAWSLLGSLGALTVGGCVGMGLALAFGSNAASAQDGEPDEEPVLSQARAREMVEQAGPAPVEPPPVDAPVFASGVAPSGSSSPSPSPSSSSSSSVGDTAPRQIHRAPPRPPWVDAGRGRGQTRPSAPKPAPKLVSNPAPIASPTPRPVAPQPQVQPQPSAAPEPVPSAAPAPLPAAPGSDIDASTSAAASELPELAPAEAASSAWPPDIDG